MNHQPYEIGRIDISKAGETVQNASRGSEWGWTIRDAAGSS